MFEKLAQKINIKKQPLTAPVSNPLTRKEREFLSKTALKLYEKQCDIEHFSKLVLADLENTEGMENLFKTGIIDPLEDEKLEMLADNRRFLRDLGLSD